MTIYPVCWASRLWYINTIMVPADPSEPALIQRARRRDPEALTELYHRYSAPIYRYFLFRVTDEAAVQDLTGEVFLNMVESLPRYTDRGTSFVAWLYRLAHDRLVDYYRRQARRRTDALTDDLPDSVPGPEAQAGQRLDGQRLRRVMSQLSDDYQLVLQLRFVEGFDVAETARTLRKSVGATKVMQHRALRELARLMKL